MSSRNNHGFARFLITLAVLLGLCGTARGDIALRIIDATDILGEARLSRDGMYADYLSRDGQALSISLDALGSEHEASAGIFHPFPADLVQRVANECLPLIGPEIQVTVYLLPGTAEEIPEPHAIGREIFLPASTQPWTAVAGARVFMHELGHAVHHELVAPADELAWTHYLHLRRIEDESIHHEDADHAERPSEIFAEDFRALYGGQLAARSGSIDNEHLGSPDDVPGLRAFMDEIMMGLYGSAPQMASRRSVGGVAASTARVSLHR